MDLPRILLTILLIFLHVFARNFQVGGSHPPIYSNPSIHSHPPHFVLPLSSVSPPRGAGSSTTNCTPYPPSVGSVKMQYMKQGTYIHNPIWHIDTRYNPYSAASWGPPIIPPTHLSSGIPFWIVN